MVKTVSVLLQNLCVPCACRCRYCLLSWDGRPVGVPWERSTAFAERLGDWMRENRPDLSFQFSFGYAMEHPDLKAALGFLRRIGSPQATFLQCDGMRLRDGEECRDLAKLMAGEGVRQLNFTFYGLRDYHDRFAGRQGDFDLLVGMLRAARDAGLAVSAGIPLTGENIGQAGALAAFLRRDAGCEAVRFFIPHGEGRGAALAPIRLRERELLTLPEEAAALLNREAYRPEWEWLAGPGLPEETERMLLLSLREDNIARYEAMEPASLLAEAEALDEAYYAAFPSFAALAERYGDRAGDRLYGRRDLFAHYRKLYAAEHGVSVYDVTDERQTGSRRF